ncbi:MAG: DUF2332 domain-containing protein [Dehalococcoidia bacterium]|nr:DUF2332 domain-containing protein [Dehalococcoidia bacterium]
MPPTLDEVREQFVFFADEECGDRAPMYAAIARGVAGDEHLLALANEGREGVRRANLLLAAVHYLVLREQDAPLARLYREGRPVPGTFDEFRTFAAQHEAELRELVRTRLVQTNEVSRCSALLPGLNAAQAAMGGRPLALIDVGASAGLHLLFDRYRYTYSPGGTTGPVDSPVEISCEVRGTVIPPVIGLPHLSSRAGIDMAPVDVGDDDAVLWLRALVWPEKQARMERLEAALSLARRAPPAVSEGDALALLPKLVEEIDREAVPAIYHSHVLAHMPEGVRRTFTGTVLPGLGASRDLAWLACEGSTMELTTWVAGVREGRRLAKRDPHGEWIEWLAE